MSYIVPRFIFAQNPSKNVKLETKYYSQETLSKYYKCKTQKQTVMIDCAIRHSRCLTCPYNNFFITHPGPYSLREH